MKLGMISFTAQGSRLCGQLVRLLSLEGYDCEGYGLEKYAPENELKILDVPLKQWTGRMFEEMDGILFIGASGIAVRSIAPFVADKKKDPAVVVMDEKGVFAISLLSGHLGGANELAGTLANLTGAIPVITTATDVNGRFAVDILAKKANLYISSMEYAKYISADILDEKPVGLVSEFPVSSAVPEELTILKPGEAFEGENGMVISLNEESRPFSHTLHLIPRIVTLGIGCRKGTGLEQIEEAVLLALRANHLSIHSLACAASISLKKEEPGILAFCEKYHLPFMTYEAEELQKVPGSFTPSEFVKKTTGVDNVCERSALLAAGRGSLIQRKRGENGVTVALAKKDWSVDFE